MEPWDLLSLAEILRSRFSERVYQKLKVEQLVRKILDVDLLLLHIHIHLYTCNHTYVYTHTCMHTHAHMYNHIYIH